MWNIIESLYSGTGSTSWGGVGFSRGRGIFVNHSPSWGGTSWSGAGPPRWTGNIFESLFQDGQYFIGRDRPTAGDGEHYLIIIWGVAVLHGAGHAPRWGWGNFVHHCSGWAVLHAAV